MTQEDSEIVHPGCGKENIVVVNHSLSQPGGQRVEPWLMAKLVHRQRLCTDEGHDRGPPVRRCHRLSLGQLGVMRIRSSPPRFSITNSGEAAGTAYDPPRRQIDRLESPRQG